MVAWPERSPTLVAASPRRFPVQFLVAPFALLVRHRRLLAATVRNEVRARFAGSVLGPIWLLLFPLLFLGTYAMVYLFVFKVRPELFSSNQYVVLIFCGLIPFLGFAEGLTGGTSSVVADARLIKNTLFPVELVPAKAIFVSQATQVVGTVMLLIAVISVGRLTLWALLLPVIWGLQVLFSIGLAWILSSLNVFLRDLQNVISVTVLLLMMLSPIAWSADMVPADIRPLLAINPLYHLIISYQECLMIGGWPRHDALLVFAAIALVTFFVGYWFFGRMKSAFADHV